MNIQFFIDRANERSSWAGLFTILISAGVEISPEMQEFVSKYGLYIAGFASMIMKDKPDVLQFFQKFINKFIKK